MGKCEQVDAWNEAHLWHKAMNAAAARGNRTRTQREVEDDCAIKLAFEKASNGVAFEDVFDVSEIDDKCEELGKDDCRASKKKCVWTFQTIHTGIKSIGGETNVSMLWAIMVGTFAVSLFITVFAPCFLLRKRTRSCAGAWNLVGALLTIITIALFVATVYTRDNPILADGYMTVFKRLNVGIYFYLLSAFVMLGVGIGATCSKDDKKAKKDSNLYARRSGGSYRESV